MKTAALYRLFLALCIAALATASALHEVAHMVHDEHAHHAEYTTSDAHGGDTGDCQFCAKGPTTSTEAFHIAIDCCLRCDHSTISIAETSFALSQVGLESLRGPPTA